MKQVLISILLFAFAYTGHSQINTRANIQQITGQYYDNDTLTNAGTVTQTPTGVVTGATQLDSLNYPYEYRIHIASDSLSGSTTATAYVETKAYNSQGHMWCPVGTAVTIDGGLKYAPITGSALSGLVRVRTVGTGTQSTRISVTIERYRLTK